MNELWSSVNHVSQNFENCIPIYSVLIIQKMKKGIKISRRCGLTTILPFFQKEISKILYNNAKLKRGERRKEGKVTSIQNFLRDEFNRATSFLPGTNNDERQRHFWTSFSRTFRKLRVPRALITRRPIHPLASLCSANEWRVHYPRQTDKTMDEWTPFRAFRDYN